MTKISVSEIETLLQLFIQKLKEENIKDFEFFTDEYWIIPTHEWSVDKNVPEPIVGSLSEDIRYLKQAIAYKAIHESNHFDRLATVFRAISEKLAPIGEKPV
jgi:hypothetical protein